MFEVPKLVAALPGVLDRTVRDRVAAQFSRFDPDHQARGTTYLSFRLLQDRGSGQTRFPIKPLDQLRLILRTVYQECERVKNLRSTGIWEGPGSDPSRMLEKLFEGLVEAHVTSQSAMKDILDSMVVVTIVADQRCFEDALRAVDYAIQCVNDKAEVGSGLSVDPYVRELCRYLSLDVGDLASRRRNASVEVEQILAGDFDALANYAVALGLTERREPECYLDYQILPPGFESEVEARRGDQLARRQKPVAYDQARLGVIDLLRTSVERKRFVECYISRPSPSIAARDSLSGALADYYVLSITGLDFPGHHAVAVSPMAGQDAIYVVREDVSKMPWQDVLSGTKMRVRKLKARKILVKGDGPWKYEVAAQKAEALLRCSPYLFGGDWYYDDINGRWTVV